MARHNSITRSAIFAADSAQNRLPFVSFALLILVVGPIITGALIDYHERQLMDSVRATRNHLNQVRALAQVPRVGRPPQPASDVLRVWREHMDDALTSAESAQERVAHRVSDLHDIQDAVVSVFGLLGLVAAFYSSRAVTHLRALASANGRRVRALEGLFDIAGHLSVSATPEAMQEYLTERAGHVLQAKRVEMWSYDSAHNTLYPLRPAFGFTSETPAPLPVREGEWPHDLLFNNATLCRNAIAQQGGDALNIQLRAWHADSALLVPLIAHNHPVGLLCAYDKRTDAPDTGENKNVEERASFHEEDAQLMRTFATQAAFVLHSARQYARAHDRGEQLSALARLTQVINSSLELSAIVPAFLQEAQALVPYGRARLALLPIQSESESWSQEYPQSDSEETDLLRRLRGKTRANSPLAAIFQEQKAAQAANNTSGSPNSTQTPLPGIQAKMYSPSPVYVWTLTAAGNGKGKSQQEPRWEVLTAEDPLQRTIETGKPQQDHVLVIPLIANQELLGALAFEIGNEAGNTNGYGEHHLQLAQQAAGQLSAAVQNAQLYQEATHRAEQMAWSLQETDHRIKNNLQAITAILDLYTMEAEADKRAPYQEEETLRQAVVAREGLAHAMREVRTIAAVHELISEDKRISRVKADALIEKLIPTLLTGPIVAGKHLHISTHVDDLLLPSKLASTLALAVNELIVNAVRHGGKERSEVTLHVALHHQGQNLCLTVEDDGPGFPADFNAQQHGKIGLSLTRMMIERDLSGKLTYANNETNGGATVTAQVPYKESSSPTDSLTH